MIRSVEIKYFARLLKNNKRRTVETVVVTFNDENYKPENGKAFSDREIRAIAIAHSRIEDRCVINAAIRN